MKKISNSVLHERPSDDLGQVYNGDHHFFSEYAANLSNLLAASDWTNVLRLAKTLIDARKKQSKIFLCGNGGSAANADHLANDFVYAVAKSTGNGLDATSLCANSAVICCLANDVGYEDVFSEQLAVSGRKGDVLIALSGSGNSPNVIKALNMANSLKMETVAVLGFDGGKCKNLATIPIHFPINDMQIAEDLQLVVGHMTMRWIEAQIKKSG